MADENSARDRASLSNAFVFNIFVKGAHHFRKNPAVLQVHTACRSRRDPLVAKNAV